MNQNQLELIAKDLKLSDTKLAAAELVIIHGRKPYQAEMSVYGRPTNSVARIVQRIRARFAHCLEVACA